MSLGEFQLIDRFFARSNSASQKAGVRVGIGDDGAVLALPQGHELVVSTDTLVEGIHFPQNCSPADLASRALRVNLSDLAAMSATPLAFTLALTLPKSDETWLASFATRLLQEAEQFSIPLVGGDTTRGPLVIGITVFGTVPAGEALLRSTAQVGDDIWVTGTLGDAARIVQLGQFSGDSTEHMPLNRYWHPTPRLHFSSAARPLLNAGCDISDGLLADLGHICHRSAVGAELMLANLPFSATLKALPFEQAAELALTGGDDYELCLTANPQHRAALEALAEKQPLAIRRVGKIVAGSKVVCWNTDGNPWQSTQSGYTHF